jgi:hypothetical protein
LRRAAWRWQAADRRRRQRRRQCQVPVVRHANLAGAWMSLKKRSFSGGQLAVVPRVRASRLVPKAWFDRTDRQRLDSPRHDVRRRRRRLLARPALSLWYAAVKGRILSEYEIRDSPGYIQKSGRERDLAGKEQDELAGLRPFFFRPGPCSPDHAERSLWRSQIPFVV